MTGADNELTHAEMMSQLTMILDEVQDAIIKARKVVVRLRDELNAESDQRTMGVGGS